MFRTSGPRCAAVLLALAVGSAGCSHKDADTTAASTPAPTIAAPTAAAVTSPPAAVEASAAPAAADSPAAATATGPTAAPTPKFVGTTTGRSPAPIVPPQVTYDVKYKPGTKVIDAPTVTSAYHGVDANGGMVFDASASQIAALAPNTVVLFSGLALRRVVAVQQDGGQLHVFTGPATLDEAISDGHIAYKVPLDFSHVAFAPPPGFHQVYDHVAQSPWNEPLFAVALADEVQYHYAGTVDDWDIDLNLQPQNGDLHMSFKASKANSMGGGTIEVAGDGELDSLTNSVDITLANGSTTQMTFGNTNLHGKVHMTWKLAFDKAHGGAGPTKDEPEVANLPLGFSLPIEAGPLPLKLEFKTGFAFEPFIKSDVTVAQGEYNTTFGGNASVTAGSGPPPSDTPATDITGDGSINSYGGTLSLAPLGLSTTLAMPKILLTLAVPEALDNVLGELKSLTAGITSHDPLNVPGSPFKGIMGETEAGPYITLMTQANFIATGQQSIVQCERRELKVMVWGGVSTNLFGHDLAAVKGKNLYEKDYTQVEPPNIKICQPNN